MPSLYANLLGGLDGTADAPKQATISAAPVKYDFKAKAEEVAQEEKKASDAALRFQPIKRPQVVQKPKSRPIPSSSSPDKLPSERKPPAVAATTTTSSIEQWASTEDGWDDDAFAYNRRQEEEKKRARWQSKKRKKNKGSAKLDVDFDQIYDPAKPTNIQAYHQSDEPIRAQNDWKTRLHAHQMKRRRTSTGSSAEHDQIDNRPKMSFAPPSFGDTAPPAQVTALAREDSDVSMVESNDSNEEPYEPPAAGIVPEQSTRIEPSSTTHFKPNATASLPTPVTSSPAPNQRPGVISAPAVHYEKPKRPLLAADEDPENQTPQSGIGFDGNASTSEPGIPDVEDEDAPRSNRPGQKGFAKRLLQKYGWQEGHGLGAEGTGIITHLRHQTEKRKKLADAQGGGWAAPAAMGKIVGGKRRKIEGEEDGQQWSIVAKFDGMLDGLDVNHEMSENNLMQQMGEKMAEYGHVERLFINRDQAGSEPVFVKFTSALSAYRAIEAGHGQDFLGNGRVVTAGFFDADKFEQGEYE